MAPSSASPMLYLPSVNNKFFAALRGAFSYDVCKTFHILDNFPPCLYLMHAHPLHCVWFFGFSFELQTSHMNGCGWNGDRGDCRANTDPSCPQSERDSEWWTTNRRGARRMSAGLERPSVMLLCRLNIYPLISSRFGFSISNRRRPKATYSSLNPVPVMRQLNKLISYQGTSSIWKCLTHWIDAFFYRIEANFEWPPTAKISFHRWWNFLGRTAKKFCVNPSIGSIQFIFCLRLGLRNRVYYHLCY